MTVADVLDDPAKFEGLTLNDPVEGYDHRINAMILRRSDGEPYLRPSRTAGRSIA